MPKAKTNKRRLCEGCAHAMLIAGSLNRIHQATVTCVEPMTERAREAVERVLGGRNPETAASWALQEMALARHVVPEQTITKCPTWKMGVPKLWAKTG